MIEQDRYADAKQRLLKEFLASGATPTSIESVKKQMLEDANQEQEQITEAEFAFEFGESRVEPNQKHRPLRRDYSPI